MLKYIGISDIVVTNKVFLSGGLLCGILGFSHSKDVVSEIVETN